MLAVVKTLQRGNQLFIINGASATFMCSIISMMTYVHAPGCYRLLAHDAMLSSLRNLNLHVIIGEVRESCVITKATGDIVNLL